MTVSGDNIREARERAGLTQEQLAQRLGVTMRTVGNWERGATVPKSRQAAIRAFLAPSEDQPGLHSASDAELLAEIARRFARAGKEQRHDAAPMNGAGTGGPAHVVDVSGKTDRVSLPERETEDSPSGHQPQP